MQLSQQLEQMRETLKSDKFISGLLESRLKNLTHLSLKTDKGELRIKKIMNQIAMVNVAAQTYFKKD